ncbi:hypothetical protein [Burkholderia pyrrocinia]|uniref:hypothetical protein n=1 Tax=Burkholderia pyrrocinia TaxID=60550 RepID=UPI0024BF950E|nr:hypothetical protein [Burkholderia pyrrocinia]
MRTARQRVRRRNADAGAARGRLNGLFVGGGALGAALAGSAWAWGGWSAVCGVGVGFAFAGAAALFELSAGRRTGAAASIRPRM